MAIVMTFGGDSLSVALSDFSRGEPKLLYFLCIIWVAAFFGAGLAGLLTADAFGRPGLIGFVTLLISAPLATVLGSAIAMMLLAPVLDGSIPFAWFIEFVLKGAFVIPFAVMESEIVVLIWMLLMLTVHLAMRRLRSKPRNPD